MKKVEVVNELNQMIRDLESTKELYEDATCEEIGGGIRGLLKEAWNILDEIYAYVEEEN